MDQVSDQFDLGTHTRAISTSSEQAQHWFNIGLKWCYCFNQEEGVRCFKKALEYDPSCVMAHWGVAYGSGPFYNYLWRDHGPSEATRVTALCYQQIQIARSHADSATPVENQLVEALAQRFQQPHAVADVEFDRWDDAYANAMRKVYLENNSDHDVIALCVEALITRTAWKLWDVKRGVPPPDTDTYEALALIKQSIALNDANGTSQHPAILHMHIHATEMSDHPETALGSADQLSSMCPDGGHMNHMPGHIYLLCGDYEKARAVSENAIRADQKYLEYAGPYNFYTTARCHDLHLMMYTYMFLGRYEQAMETAHLMCDTLSEDVLTVPDRPQVHVTMEGYYSMKMHVLVRFGRWQQIVNEPMPANAELYCVSTAMHHYAKGVAQAALKNFAAAERERELFNQSVARIPESRRFFNNSAHSILGIGEKMIDGELAYHKGNYTEAFEHLRESVYRDDNLAYNEPWAWMHPPRHALAALLAEQAQYEEAEEVYRTDLGLNNKLQRCAQHPDNVWSLHGLVECLRHRAETVELPLYESKLKEALARSDGSVSSSCMCRTVSHGS